MLQTESFTLDRRVSSWATESHQLYEEDISASTDSSNTQGSSVTSASSSRVDSFSTKSSRTYVKPKFGDAAPGWRSFLSDVLFPCSELKHGRHVKRSTVKSPTRSQKGDHHKHGSKVKDEMRQDSSGMRSGDSVASFELKVLDRIGRKRSAQKKKRRARRKKIVDQTVLDQFVNDEFLSDLPSKSQSISLDFESLARELSYNLKSPSVNGEIFNSHSQHDSMVGIKTSASRKATESIGASSGSIMSLLSPLSKNKSASLKLETNSNSASSCRRSIACTASNKESEIATDTSSVDGIKGTNSTQITRKMSHIMPAEEEGELDLKSVRESRQPDVENVVLPETNQIHAKPAKSNSECCESVTERSPVEKNPHRSPPSIVQSKACEILPLKEVSRIESKLGNSHPKEEEGKKRVKKQKTWNLKVKLGLRGKDYKETLSKEASSKITSTEANHIKRSISSRKGIKSKSNNKSK